MEARADCSPDPLSARSKLEIPPEKIRKVLEDPNAKGFLITNDFLAIVTIVSVIAIVFETVPRFSEAQLMFDVIEYFTVAIFTAEYLLRTYATKEKRAYVFGFFGIIDLLAIAPTYLALGNFTFLKTARVLRILRLLRMIRLTKIARVHKLSELEKNVSVYWLNIGIYAIALVCIVLLLGGLMYVAEGGNPDFATIPLGMLWALKLVVGGVGGSIVAQVSTTALGEAVAIFARFWGLLLLGLLISVVGNVVQNGLLGGEKKKS